MKLSDPIDVLNLSQSCLIVYQKTRSHILELRIPIPERFCPFKRNRFDSSGAFKFRGDVSLAGSSKATCRFHVLDDVLSPHTYHARSSLSTGRYGLVMFQLVSCCRDIDARYTVEQLHTRLLRISRRLEESFIWRSLPWVMR